MRPRSSRAHAQVIDAALKLFAARGVDATSMDAIASSSGVSKATIYKHWPGKGALCLEVMGALLGRDQPRPVTDSGDLRADLAAALSYQRPSEHAGLRGRLMPHLVAYAARNPSVGLACRESVFGPPRKALRQILDRGVARGELPRTLDRDLAIAMLLGPLMYCHLLRRLQGEVPPRLPERVVEAFWQAHATRTPVVKRRAGRSARSRR